MTWTEDIDLHVEAAIGYGTIGTPPAKLKLSIGSASAGVSDNRIAYGAIGTTQQAGYFIVGDSTYGKIGTGGRFPGDGNDDSSFTPLTPYTQQVSVKRSKAGRFSSFDTGTCNITVLDHSRDFDPFNLSGPYAVNGQTLLTRGRRVRIYANWGSARRYLFSGFVDSWPSDLVQWQSATRTIQCVDWFGILAQYDGYAQAAVGSGETVTARINRLLDLAEVPSTDRDIGTSAVTVQSTTLAGNLLTQLKLAVATDGGHIWVSPDGKVTFRSRTEIWQSTNTNNVTFTITNIGSSLSSTGTLYSGVPSIAESDAFSAIFLSRVGGTTQTATNSTLKNNIGWATFERSDLLHTSDSDVARLAGYLLAAQPPSGRMQFTAVTVRPDVHDAARALVFGLKPFDRVRVEHAYPVAGLATVARDAVITGVEHQLIAGNSSQAPTWKTVLSLEDVTGLHAFRIGASAIGSSDFIP